MKAFGKARQNRDLGHERSAHHDRAFMFVYRVEPCQELQCAAQAQLCEYDATTSGFRRMCATGRPTSRKALLLQRINKPQRLSPFLHNQLLLSRPSTSTRKREDRADTVSVGLRCPS